MVQIQMAIKGIHPENILEKTQFNSRGVHVRMTV